MEHQVCQSMSLAYWCLEPLIILFRSCCASYRPGRIRGVDWALTSDDDSARDGPLSLETRHVSPTSKESLVARVCFLLRPVFLTTRAGNPNTNGLLGRKNQIYFLWDATLVWSYSDGQIGAGKNHMEYGEYLFAVQIRERQPGGAWVTTDYWRQFKFYLPYRKRWNTSNEFWSGLTTPTISKTSISF